MDLANACYGLMLRLLGYAYGLAGPSPEKALTVDLAIGLMQALVPLAEHAARLPAGPSNPNCNAGMSFVTLRDAGMLAPGRAARRLFVERFAQLADAAATLAAGDAPRAGSAPQQLVALSRRAARGFDLAAVAPAAACGRRGPGRQRARGAGAGWPRATGVERIAGEKLDADLRGQALHPLALLRDACARRCSSPTCRARGSTRMPCRWSAWWRLRTPARRARSATAARDGAPEKPHRR